MKNQNYENIIRLLMEYGDKEYISSEKIAYFLNISKRTVLTYMNKLREESAARGFELVAKQGAGCKLVIHDRETFDKWYQEDGLDDNLSEVERRRKQIFFKLITSSNYINIYDLADELYVSASLVRKDIKTLRPLADRYHLTIRHSHSHGYIIVGKEKDIRKAIANECSDWVDLSVGIESGEHRTRMFEMLSSSIQQNLTKNNISISKQAVNSLGIHFLVAINRVETNNIIKVETSQEEDTPSAEYQAIQQINQELDQIFGLSLPEAEVRYLAAHIKGRTFGPLDRRTVPDTEDLEVIEFYGLFLRSIYKQCGIDLFDDDNLQLNLLNHISLFLYRMKNDEQIVKSNLSGVKDEFPYANELAILGLRSIKQKYHKDITEEETLYFAIHLALALENNKPLRGYNLAVVLDDSVTVFKLFSHKLKQALKERINMIQLFSYNEVTEEELDQFDIIINATGKKLWFSQPTISTEAVISETDIFLVEMLMDKLDKEDHVKEMFRRDLYYTLTVSNKAELLETVIRDVSKKLDFDADAFYSSVMERERFGSTAYSKRVAVPHPMEGDKFPYFIAICRLNKPVLWDDKNVELVFLVNGIQKTMQLLFQELSKAILDGNKMYLLQRTTTFEEFVDEFCK